MLRTRVLTALVGIPLFVGILIIPKGWAFALAVSVLCGIGCLELARAYDLFHEPMWAGVGLLLFTGATLPLVAWWFRTIPPTPIAFIVVAACITMLVSVWRGHKLPVGRILGLGMFGMFYIGWLMSFVVLLRLPTESVAFGTLTVERGVVQVMWLMAMLWAGDSSAYFVGRAIGRHKLAPTLSPGKTIEGALANFAFCTLIGWLGAGWVGLDTATALFAGAGVGILGQLGDLFASALKRSIGIKDFGGILPGHGGVLDRFDSLLFTAPWVYWVLNQ